MTFKDEHCIECDDSFKLSEDKKSCESLCRRGNEPGHCNGCTDERLHILVQSFFNSNCYYRIHHCKIYDDEHCNECADSYELSPDKKYCNFICKFGQEPGECKSCANPALQVLVNDRKEGVNCYNKIQNCALYEDEHCIECQNSYTLNDDKLSCKLICHQDQKPDYCISCLLKKEMTLFERNCFYTIPFCREYVNEHCVECIRGFEPRHDGK